MTMRVTLDEFTAGAEYSLLPCPFCGGEAHIVEDEPTKGCCFVECGECSAMTAITDRRHAVGRWNARAAVELDDFFYLPKPRQQLCSITSGLSFDDVGMKATGTIGASAYVDAVLNWQAEIMNEKIIKRICEVWNPERTCTIARGERDHSFVCSECGKLVPWPFEICARPNYCPNCGARVVE